LESVKENMASVRNW